MITLTILLILWTGWSWYKYITYKRIDEEFWEVNPFECGLFVVLGMVVGTVTLIVMALELMINYLP